MTPATNQSTSDPQFAGPHIWFAGQQTGDLKLYNNTNFTADHNREE